MALTTPDRTTPLCPAHAAAFALPAAELALQSDAATPPRDAAIERTLQARFEGDRTGTCVPAAIVDPQGLRRA